MASIRNVYEHSFIYSILFTHQEDAITQQDMCWIGLSDFEVAYMYMYLYMHQQRKRQPPNIIYERIHVLEFAW